MYTEILLGDSMKEIYLESALRNKAQTTAAVNHFMSLNCQYNQGIYDVKSLLGPPPTLFLSPCL